MKIILGQGNPETKYIRTRHNVGWDILAMLADKQGVVFKPKSKLFANIAEVTVAGTKVLLVLPTTYYNETGKAARAIIDFYKLSPEDLLVLHDELALPFGKLRTRHSGRDAGNNGIKSLNSHIGQSYARVRIGVNSDLRNHLSDSDFVLKKFSQEEWGTVIDKTFPFTSGLIEEFVDGSLEDTSYSL